MATIRKRGNRWHIQIRKNGHKPITKSFTDKKNAEIWIKKTESEIERGIFLDITEAQRTTLSEIMDRYASEVLPYKRAQRTELSSIGLFKREIGNLFLASVNSSHIAALRDKRLKQVNPQSVKRELGLLQRIINTAIKDWGINLPHGNPVQQIRMPKLPGGRDRRLTIEEEQKLIANSSHYLRPIILWAIETAMRRGEIALMQWAHVDLKSKTLLVPETKTDNPRHIPLSRKAIEVLVSLPRRLDGMVFSLKEDSITQAFERTCKRAGITDLRFHDLRHEATSRLFEKGLNPMEVAAITGHRDMKMLMRYTHLKAENLVHKLG